MGSRAASTHVPRSTCISSHGAEAAMLIIVDADVSALVGKEKNMRVKAFIGAD
jgi:hypothetical protein